VGWAAAVSTALIGCSQSLRLDGSATGGVALEMFVRGEANLAALYRVEPAGTISFGGGADALNRQVTWTGPMTAAEIDELRSLLDRHGWFAKAPGSTGEPPQRSYRIRLTTPEGRRRHFWVRGASEDVTPIHDLLERLARRRLDADHVIESLPRPSQPPG
jgi:hypothetical protein